MKVQMRWFWLCNGAYCVWYTAEWIQTSTFARTTVKGGTSTSI